jgi:hypothetical protein
MQIMKLLVVYFSSLSCYLIRVRPRYCIFHSTTFSENLSLCSSHSAKDHCFIHILTKGKIIVLCILIFIFL